MNENICAVLAAAPKKEEKNPVELELSRLRVGHGNIKAAVIDLRERLSMILTPSPVKVMNPLEGSSDQSPTGPTAPILSLLTERNEEQRVIYEMIQDIIDRLVV